MKTNSHTLSALEPLTSYEVVVCSPCGTSEICDTTVVTTTNVSCELAGDFEYSYECGPTGPVDPFENEEAITFLNAGDSVWAGDFLVEVSAVEGSGPQFNGYGYAKVPYLNGARVKVNFQQIEVNDNCRMIGGEMVLVSPITEALLEIQGALAEILDVLGDINTVLGNISSVLGDVTGILNDVATSADVTDEALAIIDQTAITLTNVPYMPDSLVQAIQDGADCLENAARPAPGDDAEVRRCRDQTIAAIAAAQAFVDALFDAPYAIDFTPTDRIYGFDQQPHPLVTEDYPQRTINDQPYLTPWISTSTADAQGTALRAVRADGQPLPSDVSFIEAADVASEGWTNNGADATHPGLSAGGDQQTKIIFASIPNPEAGDTLPPVTLAGQANLVTYTPVVKTVHVVPVNGATVPLSAAALRDSLNKYYRPAVASWNVVVQPNLEVLDFDGELSDIPNSLLSNYTGEMAQLRSTVKSQSYHDEDALYLIVVPSMEEAGRLGYMPRKRRFGFLTAAGNADPFTFARTAAHELAHGAFHLQHIYDRFDPLEPGNTDNLMDSGLGTALYKYQWDNVHDPESNFTLFDEEEEGESALCAGPYPDKEITVEGERHTTTSTQHTVDPPGIRNCSTTWVGHLGASYQSGEINVSYEAEWIKIDLYKFFSPIYHFSKSKDVVNNPFFEGNREIEAQAYIDYFEDREMVAEDDFLEVTRRLPGALRMTPVVSVYNGMVDGYEGAMNIDFQNDGVYSIYGQTTALSMGETQLINAMQGLTGITQQVHLGEVFRPNSNMTVDVDNIAVLGSFVHGTGPKVMVYEPDSHTSQELTDSEPVREAISAYQSAAASGDAVLSNGYYIFRYSLLGGMNFLAILYPLWPGGTEWMETLIGSCTVGVKPLGGNEYDVVIFNSTNAFSGDVFKEPGFFNKIVGGIYISSTFSDKYIYDWELDSTYPLMRQHFGKTKYSTVAQFFKLGTIYD